MLLGLSGLNQDAQVSFEAVVGSGHGDGGITHGQLLSRLAEAMWQGDPSALVAVRDEVMAAMGGQALVDAVGVSANFHMMTRIADGTGTPVRCRGDGSQRGRESPDRCERTHQPAPDSLLGLNQEAS